MQTTSATGTVVYTTRAQRVFGYAQREAQRRGQRYVGPEHLLLGLLTERDNLACQTLKRLQLSVEDLAEQADRRMACVETEPSGSETEVELTPRAHRVAALAYHEAQRLRHNSVGTEHLLLGLLRERDGLPGRLLARADVDLERARNAVMAQTGGKPVDFKASASPPEAMTIPGLLAALKHDGRSGKPVLGLEWLVAYLFASLMLFVVLVRAAPWYDDWSFFTYMLFCAVVLRWVYLVINRMVASPQQRQAAQRLTQLQDKRVVGHLVDFCTWPDALVRQAARKALISMLPRLQAADASLLSSEQQGVLRGMLHRRHVEAEPGLQIAILKAYEQMGDERALPAVNALATMRPNTKNRQRVRVAAEECLPFLQQRRQRQVSSQTLLRPTQLNTPEPPREVLLRPAHDQSASNPAELLRPNASEDPAGT